MSELRGSIPHVEHNEKTHKVEVWIGRKDGSGSEKWALTPDDARYVAMLLVEYAEHELSPTGIAVEGHNSAMIMLKRRRYAGLPGGGPILIQHDELMVRGTIKK